MRTELCDIEERIARHNRAILAALDELMRVASSVREDAESNSVPRYATHLQQHVDRMVVAAAKIEERRQL